MPLPTRDVVGILVDNLRIRGSVLPIPARQATRWARELALPMGGETVLYTGLMYQLIPYIERLVALELRLGDTPLARFTGLGRADEPARERRRLRRETVRTGARRVRSRARQRRPAAPHAPASSSATCTRTTCMRERSRTTSAPTRPSRRMPGAWSPCCAGTAFAR